MSELMKAIEELAKIIANDPKIGEDEINQILLDSVRKIREIKQSQNQKE